MPGPNPKSCGGIGCLPISLGGNSGGGIPILGSVMAGGAIPISLPIPPVLPIVGGVNPGGGGSNC